NQESWNAISAYAKDQGLSVSCYSYLQATSESDFIPFLSQMGEDEMDIVIVPGSTISSVLEEVAINYPSTSYVAIASIEASNVVAVEFDHDSPMYLAGVTAALKAVAAQANKVGYIGYEESSLNEIAFKEGVAYVAPELEILSSYVGDSSVEDTQKVAHDLYNEGAYVIYADSSSNILGVYNETSTRRSNGEDVWLIDLSEELPVEGQYVSSVLIGISYDMGTVIRNCIKEKRALTLIKEGIKTIYMGNDTGYSLANTNNLSPEMLVTISEINEKIIHGEIVIGSSIVEIEEENTEKE
ncbi:MAG: BMP family ABC transporter substrate-binding protein, partial [Erysipelotrichales bacterium]|nr:BMP family ABC transporter substrate-binding protein [Erysipelotrichales bacterium]